MPSSICFLKLDLTRERAVVKMRRPVHLPLWTDHSIANFICRLQFKIRIDI